MDVVVVAEVEDSSRKANKQRYGMAQIGILADVQMTAVESVKI